MKPYTTMYPAVLPHSEALGAVDAGHNLPQGPSGNIPVPYSGNGMLAGPYNQQIEMHCRPSSMHPNAAQAPAALQPPQLAQQAAGVWQGTMQPGMSYAYMGPPNGDPREEIRTMFLTGAYSRVTTLKDSLVNYHDIVTYIDIGVGGLRS